MSERVVVKVAVQDAAAVLDAAIGVQFAALPSAVAPFLNCTVPVGPAPLLFVATVAVSVTLVPAVIEEGLDVTEVAVAA